MKTNNIIKKLLLYIFIGFSSAYANNSAATCLDMSGEIGYSISNYKTNIKIENIDCNFLYFSNSGSIKVRLWASINSSSNGKGYTLGEFSLNPLNAGHFYKNIDKTVNYTPPPAGDYYVYVLLLEYGKCADGGTDYCIADKASFGKETFSGGGGGCTLADNTNPILDPLLYLLILLSLFKIRRNAE